MVGTTNPASWKTIPGPGLGSCSDAKCSSFALATSPLTPGDTVMMVIDIMANPTPWTNTSIFFTYDPNSKQTGEIDAKGTVDAPTFSFSVNA
jgi:hypothetical protein